MKDEYEIHIMNTDNWTERISIEFRLKSLRPQKKSIIKVLITITRLIYYFLINFLHFFKI